MKKELAPKYNHLDVEQGYDNWIKEGYFTAGDKSKDPFCIVIPPPNVTGKLHLGHAWIRRCRISSLVTSGCRATTCRGFQAWIMPESQRRRKLMSV